jgi:hypothetical protein
MALSAVLILFQLRLLLLMLQWIPMVLVQLMLLVLRVQLPVSQ